jgi:protein-L-isoaspartate(D-aspartate) O-methyltransferase
MRFDRGQPPERMVEQQLAHRGIRDPAVMRAMAALPREPFVSSERPDLPRDQTIPDLYKVALMADALGLEPGDKVLEIGTGSGYGAAVFSKLAHEVFTIERQITLCKLARDRLHDLKLSNVHVRCGDGTAGWPEEAPFDAIAVASGDPSLPSSLRGQLAIGGRLVIAVRDEGAQRLLRVWRTDDLEFEQEDLGGLRFMPPFDG